IKSLHFKRLHKQQQESIKQIAEDYKDIIAIDSYLYNGRFKVMECYAPYYMSAIDTKGNFWGCCKIRDENFRIGNLIVEDIDTIEMRLKTKTPIKRKLLCPPNCLGITPYPEVDSFGILYEGKKEFVIAVDLDGVITPISSCHHSEYVNLRPNTEVVENLRQLKKQGAKIIIHTSRLNEDKAITETWLTTHQIPYDDIIFEKLRADIYLDDRNVIFESGWKQKLEQLIEFRKLNSNEEETDVS
ncbi:MAG: hypothetical protein GF311_15055, partial [Candidatus Lokiarchaeota archaeon]|nr:hypothetical protein [Candidatus Lokiarchaeota archaeon]